MPYRGNFAASKKTSPSTTYAAAIFDNRRCVVSMIWGMWSVARGYAQGRSTFRRSRSARKMASFSSRISAMGRPPWRFETMIMSSSMSVMFWT